jgi:hypothetical protein
MIGLQQVWEEERTWCCDHRLFATTSHALCYNPVETVKLYLFETI